MYKNHNHFRNHSENRGNKRFGGFKSKRNQPKKLDFNLFIKKAKDTITPIEKKVGNKTFSDFALCDKLISNITEHSFTHPTPIQQESIPAVLKGADLIGIAKTGTGKTAAFLIPLINKVYNNKNERVLIITPTRELAMQIADEFFLFSKDMNLRKTLCIGGANIQRQGMSLQNNPDFVIATPGRLNDLIRRRKINLSTFNNIVLDEVDRMLDIGFINEVKYFISLLAPKRQSLFFSATISLKVKEIIKTFVKKEAVTISIKQEESENNIDQDIVRVNEDNKVSTLRNLLLKDGFNKVIVFGRTKYGVEKLEKSLIQSGFKVGAIHGNKRQGYRKRVIEQFRKDEISILLATDVASRGLDIEDITHVINYDAPETYDDYIHRIGRTGRAGKKGSALTFIN